MNPENIRQGIIIDGVTGNLGIIGAGENQILPWEWNTTPRVTSESKPYWLLSDYGLGWNIDLDLKNKRFVFVVKEGRNLVANQTGLPQAIFSTEFETIESLEYTESDFDYKNFAVVAGQGEGIERRIISIGDAAGADRYEMFVDARDVSEEDDKGNPRPDEKVIADLNKSGNEKMSGHAQEIYLSGQILTTSRLIFEKITV